MAELLRWVRERPWVTPCLLFIVLGVFTLTAHGRGHALLWVGIVLCAAGVLTGVLGYLGQRGARGKGGDGRPA